MVIGYHIIFATYGFWLPNDPRGSWSDFVRSWKILKHGHATKIKTTKSVAHTNHNQEHRCAAKNALRYPPVHFNGQQARACARGFAESAAKSQYVIHACAILPDHVHMVVKNHPNQRIEQIIGQLKAAATRQLITESIHPLQEFHTKNNRPPSPWVVKGWKVFLNSPKDIHRAIEYVNNNPIKDGLKPQKWNFVQPPTTNI